MKNKRFLFVSLLIAGCYLGAVETFHLIRARAQLQDSRSFSMLRDLFVTGPAPDALPLPVESPDMTENADMEPKAEDVSSAADIPVPMDVVLLGAIVRQNRRCALIAVNGEMKVYEEGETLDNGWLIEQVTLSTVLIRTEKQTMMLAVEGEGHE